MIRRATEADLPEMRRVFDAARAYMAAQGNPNQWEPGYPTDEVLRGDMARGGLHVLTDDTGIYGAFAFLTGDDPTYAEIDGAWLSDRPYATIHRVASDGTHRGVFAEVMAFAMAMQPHLRIDTHALNLPMQRQIERFGFRYCGVIQCRNGARMAFERLLEKSDFALRRKNRLKVYTAHGDFHAGRSSES